MEMETKRLKKLDGMGKVKNSVEDERQLEFHPNTVRCH